MFHLPVSTNTFMAATATKTIYVANLVEAVEFTLVQAWQLLFETVKNDGNIYK